MDLLEEFDEEEIEQREIFNDRFYTILAHSKSLLEKFDSPSDKSSVAGVHALPEQDSRASEGVKLPDIKLPKFHGSFHAWLDFRDIFSSLIHQNSKLNEIQKFHYLRASLIGSSSQVIQAIEFCSLNYELAWNTLCESYNNNNLLIQNHVNAIFTMESINLESASKIRNLSDNLFKHLLSLKQLTHSALGYFNNLHCLCKLDKVTSREWEKTRAKQQGTCTIEFFKNFLKERADLLENIEMNSEKSRNNDQRFSNRGRQNTQETKYHSRGLYSEREENEPFKNDYTRTKFTCFLCKDNHKLFYCREFLRLSINDRLLKVRSLHLCENCLRRNHSANDCRWSGCKNGGEKHNTTLHNNVNRILNVIGLTRKDSESLNLDGDLIHNTSCNFINSKNAILCTAKVKIPNFQGKLITARAILDCGSQSSFMTTDLSNKLNLPKRKTDLTITGINNKLSRSTYKCDIQLYSSVNDFNFPLTCFILDKITNDLPDAFIDRKRLNIPKHLELADPEFDTTHKIDLLIGADLFWHILSDGKISLGTNGPILQNTRIGWVLAGPLSIPFTNTTVCNLSRNRALQEQLAKFWKIEESHESTPLSSEEALCEKHFVENYRLSSEGRYIVSLPLKDSPIKLGNSGDIAMKRFVSLERKLYANERLRSLYVDFLDEYEKLGHMTNVTNVKCLDKVEYFLPYHVYYEKQVQQQNYGLYLMHRHLLQLEWL